LVRPFGLRDIILVRKLQNQCTNLDLPEAFIRPRSSMWMALLGFLFHRDLGAATCVLNDYEKDRILQGFVQIRMRRNRPEGTIITLAPSLDSDDAAPQAWDRLLRYACRIVGEQGISRLLAQASSGGHAEEVFRSLDFGVYTRAAVYRCPSSAVCSRIDPPEITPRRRRPQDDWGLHHLYLQATPSDVEIAEGDQALARRSNVGPLIRGHGTYEYILEDRGEIRGYLELATGQKGYALRVIVRPKYPEVGAHLLDWGCSILARYPARPVYYSVRQYETGVQSWLAEHGFELVAERSLIVKHLAVRVKKAVRVHAPALEKRAETVPTHSEEYKPGRA